MISYGFFSLELLCNENITSTFLLYDQQFLFIFLETIVEPNQQHYPWYHEKLQRVPTIDECYSDDPVCRYEATQQMKRDKRVDNEIMNILRNRFEECVAWETPDHQAKCRHLWDYFKRAEENWFSKCK